MTALDNVSLPSAPTGLVSLDAGATEPSLVGNKASALARCRIAGLPVLDGMVLTTEFCTAVDSGTAVDAHPAIDALFVAFGDQPLAVRSSSPIEDQTESSMAGRFESVLDVRGRAALVRSVQTVLDSRRLSDRPDHDPIAVLIQPFVVAQLGGVAFGIDPVSGRSDRVAVVASSEGPDAVVSGQVDGTRNVLGHDGRRTDTDSDRTLPHALRVGLVDLLGRVESLFGRPQDIEWMRDGDGVLHLLQSRPVTTAIRGVPQGPLYGPGPVAETFPDPLSRLERDLWVPSLRTAMGEALVLAGAAPRRRVEATDVVIAPGGRVAVDLEITGELEAGLPWWRRLSPVRQVRRLRSAWRVGRLRAALPVLARDLVDTTDRELRAVPPVAQLTHRQLVALIDRGRQALVSLHAHEMLIGLLVDPEATELTGASVALRVLAEGRRAGLSDEQILADSPIVLALCAPRVGAAPELPKSSPTLPPGVRPSGKADPAGVLREALRLRVRWVHALTGRAAHELGGRLVDRGQLEEADDIRHLPWDDVAQVALDRAVIVAARPDPSLADDLLPGSFRMSDRGMPVAEQRPGSAGDARGAGGGTGTGVVSHDTHSPPKGAVLVVPRLEPSLAPLLVGLEGLVAETGSPLAHLAILARESGVATVVGLADATGCLPEGSLVRVHGDTGLVEIVEQEEAAR